MSSTDHHMISVLEGFKRSGHPLCVCVCVSQIGHNHNFHPRFPPSLHTPVTNPPIQIITTVSQHTNPLLPHTEAIPLVSLSPYSTETQRATELTLVVGCRRNGA